MRALFALLPLFISPAGAADDLSTETDRQLLERITKGNNSTSSKVFEELGKRKTKESLNALEAGFAGLTALPAVKSAAKAFRHYKGVEGLERSAVNTLFAATQDAKKAIKRNAAVGLALFPEVAASELDHVVTRSDDDVTRANALAGLLPSLSATGGKRELKKVTQNLRTTLSLTRAKAIKAFGTFLDEGGSKLFKGMLADDDIRIETRRIIAAALKASNVEGAELRLRDGLKASEESLVYQVLILLAERGCEDYGKELRRLVRSKDPAIRRVSLIAQAKLYGGDPTFLERILDQAEHDDPVARCAAAVSLATIRTSDSLAMLHGLLIDEHHSVRMEALDAILDARHPSSIGPLLDRLSSEHGVVRPLILRNLQLLTGEDFGNSPQMWSNW